MGGQAEEVGEQVEERCGGACGGGRRAGRQREVSRQEGVAGEGGGRVDIRRKKLAAEAGGQTREGGMAKEAGGREKAGMGAGRWRRRAGRSGK